MFKNRRSLVFIGIALVLLVVCYQSVNLVHALNTNSIDLESSSTNHLSITDGSQTGLDLSSDFTIELWVKFESLPATDKNMKFVTKYLRSGDQRSYAFGITDVGGNKIFVPHPVL